MHAFVLNELKWCSCFLKGEAYTEKMLGYFNPFLGQIWAINPSIHRGFISGNHSSTCKSSYYADYLS